MSPEHEKSYEEAKKLQKKFHIVKKHNDPFLSKEARYCYITLIALIICIVFRIINSIIFDVNIEGHLKLSSDANTLELAKQELNTALKYIEKSGYTQGYTSIIYNTPKEDVGFWYKNLRASYKKLEKLPKNVSQLEESNVLIKLRETLLDTGDTGKVEVTSPDGISIFPHNGLMSFIFIFLGGLLIASLVNFFKVHGR